MKRVVVLEEKEYDELLRQGIPHKVMTTCSNLKELIDGLKEFELVHSNGSIAFETADLQKLVEEACDVKIKHSRASMGGVNERVR